MRLSFALFAGTLLWFGCSGGSHSPDLPTPAVTRRVEPPQSAHLDTEPSRLQPLGPQTRGTRSLRVAAKPTETATHVFRNAVVAQEQTRAVVLLYHAFDVGRDPLSVSSQNFDRQLEWLAQNGIEIVRLSELIRFLHGELQLPERVAVITIDDGLRSTYTRAWPSLRRRQVPFALGLSTQLIAEPSGHPMLTWPQIRELVASGLCEIASHGHAHRRLVDLPDGLARQELQLSRDIIERETGEHAVAYFYPLGAVDELARQRVKAAGYQAAFSATGGAIAIHSSPLTEIPRTAIFYADSLGHFSWYFGPQFLERLPFGWQRGTRFTALETPP